MIKSILLCIILSILPKLSIQSGNCTDGTIPCGPGTICCPVEDRCNFNRGIPVCENFQQPAISGFLGQPCADSYLNDCSAILGIPGFCCPIGTVCFNNGLDKVVSCVNAYGTTSAALPSATQGFKPSATLVPNNNASILFNPSGAWNSSNTVPSCSPNNQNSEIQTTSVINATVTFNYTGPSIMIHTVTSTQGGVFAVFVDGFNTTDVIDTFAGPNLGLPQCYPVQYPPFLQPPPTLATQNDHSIQLLYLGPSPNAPNGTTESSGQFDSFGIPSFQTVASAQGNSRIGTNGFVLVILVSTMIFCLSDLPSSV